MSRHRAIGDGPAGGRCSPCSSATIVPASVLARQLHLHLSLPSPPLLSYAYIELIFYDLPNRKVEASHRLSFVSALTAGRRSLATATVSTSLAATSAPRACDVDHVIPRSEGGTTCYCNGRLLCPAHNRIPPLRNPQRPRAVVDAAHRRRPRRPFDVVNHATLRPSGRALPDHHRSPADRLSTPRVMGAGSAGCQVMPGGDETVNIHRCPVVRSRACASSTPRRCLPGRWRPRSSATSVPTSSRSNTRPTRRRPHSWAVADGVGCGGRRSVGTSGR